MLRNKSKGDSRRFLRTRFCEIYIPLDDVLQELRLVRVILLNRDACSLLTFWKISFYLAKNCHASKVEFLILSDEKVTLGDSKIRHFPQGFSQGHADALAGDALFA